MNPRLQRILAMGRLHWPRVRFFREQNLITESLALNDETVVAAANEVGKDFVAGFNSLLFFLCPQLYFPDAYVRAIEARRIEDSRALGREMPEHHYHTRRIVTTSVKEKHLSILWGEIGRFLSSSEIPLLAARGGPLTVNNLEIRLKDEEDVKKPLNYLVGQVAQEDESMAGHHAAYTLFVVDEASSMWDAAYQQALGWARKRFLFGNTKPCTNFYYKAVRGGDKLRGVA